MKRYFDLIYHFFVFLLKSKLSYRINFLIENLHAPIYVSVQFILVLLAFNKTETLGGLTTNQAIIMYLIFNLIYSVGWILFIDGFRHFIWHSIRLGELDLMLVKPINVKFLVSFSKPATEGILYFLVIFIILVSQLIKNSELVSLYSIFNLILGLTLGLVVMYLTLLTYSAFAFFFVKAQQINEFFHKINDLGQYPKPIFPGLIQIMMITIIPMAFFSYYPTLIFLGKMKPTIFIWEIILIISLYLIQRYLWNVGLKKYTSASS